MSHSGADSCKFGLALGGVASLICKTIWFWVACMTFRFALVLVALSLTYPQSLRTAHAQSPGCVASADQTVNICSPASGSVTTTPVQFTAAALDQEHPVTGMVVYVDSQQQASSNSASLSSVVPLNAGNHTVLVRAWDSTGFFFSSEESITVVTPAVAISGRPVQ